MSKTSFLHPEDIFKLENIIKELSCNNFPKELSCNNFFSWQGSLSWAIHYRNSSIFGNLLIERRMVIFLYRQILVNDSTFLLSIPDCLSTLEPVKLTHWNKWLEQNGNERQLKRCPHKEISLFTVFMRSFKLSGCSPKDSSELFSMSEKRSERACNVFLSGKYFIYRWIWRITFRKDKRNDPISSPAMCMKFGVLHKFRMTSLHFKAQRTIFVLNYCRSRMQLLGKSNLQFFLEGLDFEHLKQ